MSTANWLVMSRPYSKRCRGPCGLWSLHRLFRKAGSLFDQTRGGSLGWAAIWEMKARSAEILQRARRARDQHVRFSPAPLEKGRHLRGQSIVRLAHRAANDGPRLPAAVMPLFEQQKPQS